MNVSLNNSTQGGDSYLNEFVYAEIFPQIMLEVLVH